MWTKKSAAIVSLAVSLILLGLIFRNLQLLAISIALLSYTSVSIFANRQSKVEPDRQLSGEKIFEDGTVKAELQITNKGYKTGFLEARDTIPKVMEIKRGSNYTYLNLKPKASTYLRYTVKCPIKGVYKLGPVTLRSHDPFNMFYKELKIDYDSTLTVFPQTRDVKELYIRSKQPKMYPGEMKVKMPGPGAEFFSIRDYTTSDAFKDINWKAYAKKKKLLVNERERLSVSDITLVYDARAASRYGVQSDNANLYGARAAATLANFFLNRRDSVQLVIYGDKVLSIKKGTGKKQLYEILTALAHAEPKGDIPLSGIVEVAIPYMPRRSPVIIISSLDDDDSIRKAVSTMCVLEFDVTIITPSSIEFERMAKARESEAKRRGRGKKGAGTDEEAIAYDVLRLERDILISELRGYGVRVVEWDPKVPLHQMLLEARNI